MLITPDLWFYATSRSPNRFELSWKSSSLPEINFVKISISWVKNHEGNWLSSEGGDEVPPSESVSESIKWRRRTGDCCCASVPRTLACVACSLQHWIQ
uniref:Uncharacterized protein n=1 Tax=Physcomitrium patens TaxID=3218 RepID=A0A2K1J2R1_PHYPA|nr:hypothetical protein PHYPA_021668 [Physcomitrium patens]